MSSYKHKDNRRKWPPETCTPRDCYVCHDRCELARRALTLVDRYGVISRDVQGDRVSEHLVIGGVEIVLSSQSGVVRINVTKPHPSTDYTKPALEFDLNRVDWESDPAWTRWALEEIGRHMVLDDLADV